MIRRSYLPALALCAAVLGPSSANAEFISQGSWSATGDSYYSTGMTAQSGAWSGETYSQGMMMADGQFYIQGMALNPQGGSSGQNYGDTSNGGYGSSNGGYGSSNGGYNSGIGSGSSASDTGQSGPNSSGGDAFTTSDAPGGGYGPDGGPLTWASFDGGYSGGNGNPPGYGNPGGDDYGSPPNGHHSVPEPTTLHLLIAAFLGLALTWAVMPLMPRRGSRCPPGEEISASAV
jgi:hypothetical protein